MQVENPIKYVPSYDSKSKDTPLTSVPPNPTAYKEPDESILSCCVICLCIEYCCCTLMGAAQ